MKRLLLILVLCLLVMPVMASATSLNFQKSTDMARITNFTVHPVESHSETYTANLTGGNNYVSVYDACGAGCWSYGNYIINNNAYPMTYAAATFAYGNAWTDNTGIILLDASKNVIHKFGDGSTNIPAGARVELKIVGGTAYVYSNGLLMWTYPGLTQNPSYVGFGVASVYVSGSQAVDDLVFGAEEDPYVLGMPASNGYYIEKNTITPASNGFYNATTGALIYSNNLPFSFSRTNLSGEALVNESIYLVNADTGTSYETQYTGVSSTGIRNFNLAAFFASSAPYGLYQTKLGTTISDEILYIASGATIYFDSDTYGRGNTASMTYAVDGAYWDTSTYTYHVKLYSASTGAVLHSYQLTSSTGTDSYTFASTDPEGVIYAVVTRTLNTGGADDWLAYDYATLSSAVVFTGYVNNAQTKLPITAANVSLVQGSTISNNITPAAGSYTSAKFIPGTPISVNVTASGYRQYTYSFTPLIGKTVNLNMTLIPMTPAVNGLAIGGVVRDTAYGQPIDSVLAESINATIVSQSTSNSAGYYLINDTLNLSYYSVHGSKAGYSNSSIYNVSVNGSVTTFTQNDIWMAGQYNRTFHITDSATGLPINVVLITSSSGDTYTTTGGTGYITESLGIYTISFSSTGYDVRTISYVFDADASSDVQLTLSTPANPPTPVYIPQQVRFTLVNLSGYPVSNVMVTATPLNFTAPSNWAQLLFGINPSVNITGTSVSGLTDSTGSFVAPMLQSINYDITMVRSPDVNLAITLMPQQLHYTITIPESYVIIPAPLGNVVVYSLQNASIDSAHQYVNMSYSDASSSGTDNLQFAVYNITGAMIASANYTGASASSQMFSQIITVSQGQSYSYGICANQSQYGWINQSSSFKLANQIALIGAAPSWVEQWIAISLIVLFAAFFSIFNKTYGLIGIPLFTWFFQFYLGWLPSNWTSTLTLAVMLAIGIALYIRMAENKIQ